MHIHGGTVDDVHGRPVVHGRFTFVPVAGTPSGARPRLLLFADDPAVGSSDVALVQDVVFERIDAAWVRGRLLHLFACPPPSKDDEALLAETFLAVAGDDSVLFEAMDVWGRARTLFDESLPEDLCAEISAAFWALLLEDPETLTPFEAQAFHAGLGRELVYRCERRPDGATSVTCEPL
jgi:hypothetical protein